MWTVLKVQGWQQWDCCSLLAPIEGEERFLELRRRKSHLEVFCFCCCSVTKLCPNLCDPVNCGTSGFPSFTNSRSWLKLMSIESVMPSNHLILCCPVLLLPSVFPSIRVFSNQEKLFTSGGQSIRASTSAPILPMNVQHWFSLGLTSLITLQLNGLSGVFSSTTVQKHQFSVLSLFYSPALIYVYSWLLEKP